MKPSFSPADFPRTKKGYNDYLKSIGVKKTTEFNPFLISFREFMLLDRPKDELTELNNKLDEINDSWYKLLKEGQDDTNIYHDAFHLKMNARRIVLRIMEIEL